MKDFFEHNGIKLYGSRDATREAFQAELIFDGDIWMDMIKSRNKTSHTYNEDTANEIFLKIVNHYYPAFMQFQKSMNDLKQL
jgi:nucleotidyltransferase substrate binding protein (TIGR01987 family)